jgi:hypothetical protein
LPGAANGDRNGRDSAFGSALATNRNRRMILDMNSHADLLSLSISLDKLISDVSYVS